MRFTIDSKCFVQGLEKVLLEGKYHTTTGMKSSGIDGYAVVRADEDLRIYNGDNSTALRVILNANIEATGSFIVDSAKLVKYLKAMNDEVIVSVGDVIRLDCAGKVATIPVIANHQTATAITLFQENFDNYTLDDENLFFGRDDTEYLTVLKVDAKALATAMKACEVVDSGITKLSYDGDLSISSLKQVETYTTDIDAEGIQVEHATVEITAPIYKLFSEGDVMLCFNDNTPILAIGENAAIFRAPYVQ